MQEKDVLDRMKAIMKKNDINAKQLTKELGISNSSFTDWGKGKGFPSVETLTKFADYFHVSLDYLVYGRERFVLKQLDFSSQDEKELLEKFHILPQEHQAKLFGYIEGLLASLPQDDEKNKRLSV